MLSHSKWIFFPFVFEITSNLRPFFLSGIFFRKVYVSRISGIFFNAKRFMRRGEFFEFSTPVTFFFSLELRIVLRRDNFHEEKRKNFLLGVVTRGWRKIRKGSRGRNFYAAFFRLVKIKKKRSLLLGERTFSTELLILLLQAKKKKKIC